MVSDSLIGPRQQARWPRAMIVVQCGAAKRGDPNACHAGVSARPPLPQDCNDCCCNVVPKASKNRHEAHVDNRCVPVRQRTSGASLLAHRKGLETKQCHAVQVLAEGDKDEGTTWPDHGGCSGIP